MQFEGGMLILVLRFGLKCSLICISVLGFILGCQSGPVQRIELDPAETIIQTHKNWIRPLEAKPYFAYRVPHRMTPLLLGDLILQGHGVDSLTLLDKKSGQIRWQKKFKGGIEGGVANVKDFLFVGTNDGFMNAISLKTAETLWQFSNKSEVLGSPIVEDGVLYYLTANNVLYALDASTGQQLWIYSRVDNQSMSVRSGSTPVIENGMLYVGFSDGFLVALNAKTGALKWEKIINKNKKFKDVDATPVLDQDYIFISGYDAQTFALKKETGEVVWKFDKGGYTPVTVAQDKLFLSTSQSEIIALQKKDGKQLWSYNQFRGVPSQATFIQNQKSIDSIVVSDTEGPVVFLNANTGRRVGIVDTGRGVFSKVAVDHEKSNAFMISVEGYLYSFSFNSKKL